MKRIAVFCLILILTVSFSACSDNGLEDVIAATGFSEEEITARYADANQAFDDKNYETAIALYDSISGYKDADQKFSLAKGEYIVSVMMQIDIFESNKQFVTALDYIEIAKAVVGEQEQLINREKKLRAAYMESVFALADKYANEKNYEAAFAVLDSIKKELGSDAQIETKLVEIQGQEISYHKTLVIEYTDAFEKTGDHSAAAYANTIGFIASELAHVGNDAEISGLYAKYQGLFRDTVLKDAEAEFAESGYEAAIGIVKNGLTTLPDSAELLNALELYEGYRPVYLSEFDYFTQEYPHYGVVENDQDNLGNTYTSSIWCRSLQNVYVLDGKYSKLTGTFYLRSEYRNGVWGTKVSGKGVLEIYADGERIYYQTMGAGDYPVNFDIDLTNVKELTVAVLGGNVDLNASHGGLGLGDCIISK